MSKETDRVQGKEYSEIITSDKFDLVIKCKKCHSYNCFIGIKDEDLTDVSSSDSSLLRMLRENEVSVPIVCANCGDIEVVY